MPSFDLCLCDMMWMHAREQFYFMMSCILYLGALVRLNWGDDGESIGVGVLDSNKYDEYSEFRFSLIDNVFALFKTVCISLLRAITTTDCSMYVSRFGQTFPRVRSSSC